MREALALLQEECAEVIQICSKLLRFGDSPEYNNKAHLEQEIGDVLALVIYLTDNGFIDADNLEKAIHIKNERLKKWSNLYNES